MEQREGFEPPVLRICNPLHWATLPPLHYFGGDGEIRTLGAGFGPHVFLAGRWFKPAHPRLRNTYCAVGVSVLTGAGATVT